MSENPDGTYAVKNAMAALAAADPAPPEVPGAPAVAAPAPAVEPPPPAGPEVPLVGAPLGPQGLSVLGQTGTQAAPGRMGVPDGIDLSPGALLGQYAAPAAPGGPPPTNAPNLRAFNNGNFLPQNEKPSAPGQGTVVGVEPGQENADISGLDWMRTCATCTVTGTCGAQCWARSPKSNSVNRFRAPLPRPGRTSRRVSVRICRIQRLRPRHREPRRHRESRGRRLPQLQLPDTYIQAASGIPGCCLISCCPHPPVHRAPPPKSAGRIFATFC